VGERPGPVWLAMASRFAPASSILRAAIDLAYRLSQGDAGSIGEPEKGGHIGCPLWIIAGVIWAVAAFNTVFGTNIRQGFVRSSDCAH